MDNTETYISLYSGGGGLDLGFKRALPNSECVAFVEHEASAAALLVDHIEAERVDALSRTQELRILGNGVVPATAEKAFEVLLNKPDS